MTDKSWLLLIVVLIVLAVIWWWWWNRRSTTPSTVSKKDLNVPLSVPTTQATSAPQAAPSAPAASTSVRPDDLTIIEGIGPKIAGLLNAAGIQSFAQLSVTDTAKIADILKANKLQFTDPTTWPEQAGLAAAGKTAELEALQNSLKGGRRS